MILKAKPTKVLIITLALALFFCLFTASAFAGALSIPMVGPSAGGCTANYQQIFTTTFNDLSGWQHVNYVYFVINTTASGSSCFYGYYNQNTNKLYIKNDAGNAWLGGFAPGSNNLIENSYVKLNCAQTTVSGSGQTMFVNWAVTFKPPFVGTKNMYLYVRDDSNAYQPLTKRGTWTIPNHTPTIVSVIPNQGTSQPEQALTFTTIYLDTDTWINIKYVYFRISPSLTGLTNCFYGYYDQDNNKLYLRNDTNTAWLGGYTPGSNYTIENSYAKLDCSKTIVTGNSDTLSINWQIIPKTTFTGTKNLYLYVRDNNNAYQGWLQKGTWSIDNTDTTPPQITQLSPVDASRIYENASVVIKPTITDNNQSAVTYQFSVDGVVKQVWSSSATYNWVSPLAGAHTIKAEAKDEAGQSIKSAEVFILRKPMEVAN
ncbi:MAG: hypothetical protein HY761_00215 [Candidatus Omnitrophica bacterium]|nr:hypothetical protein [Candidatus Omnitrophota bacterium]